MEKARKAGGRNDNKIKGRIRGNIRMKAERKKSIKAGKSDRKTTGTQLLQLMQYMMKHKKLKKYKIKQDEIWGKTKLIRASTKMIQNIWKCLRT
jgi:hypothetical protein